MNPNTVTSQRKTTPPLISTTPRLILILYARLTILLMICCITGMDLAAQAKLKAYTDLGSNNVSDGLLIRTAGIAGYRYKKYYLEAGFRIDLKSSNKNRISGYSFGFSRKFQIKDFPLTTQSFFILTPFSNVLHETNWGLLLNIMTDHFEIKAGTGFRTFVLDKKLFSKDESYSDMRINETWNLLYSFRYYLKPIDNRWNIGAAITDLEDFTIEQETNPVFNLNARYRLNPQLELFAEAWYKSAGAFNIHVDYFGYNFKLGLIWNVN